MSFLLPTKQSAGGELRLTYRGQTQVRTNSGHDFQWACWLACAKQEMQLVSEGYLLEMRLRVTYENPREKTADEELASALTQWLGTSAFRRLPQYAVYLIDTPLTAEPPYFGEHSFFNKVRISLLEMLEILEGEGEEKFDLFKAGLMTTVTREPPRTDEGGKLCAGGVLEVQSLAAFIVDGSGAPLKRKMPLDTTYILNRKDLASLSHVGQTITTESDGRRVRNWLISARPRWWTYTDGCCVFEISW